MFTLPEEKGQRIEQALAQRICTAPDGSYIRRSSGRRRPGRPFKYTVHMANGSSFVITAGDDQAAVDTANLHAAEHMAPADSANACPKCGCETTMPTGDGNMIGLCGHVWRAKNQPSRWAKPLEG